jgi:hypothetical protein
MSVELLWRRYAAAWSRDEHARPDELRACLVDDVGYADPDRVVEGAGALSDYMAQFQKNIPGAAFEIVAVLHHHDRSLARWRLRGADGTVLLTGTSAAVHAADGRLRLVSGFFGDAPAAPDSHTPDHTEEAAL